MSCPIVTKNVSTLEKERKKNTANAKRKRKKERPAGSSKEKNTIKS